MVVPASRGWSPRTGLLVTTLPDDRLGASFYWALITPGPPGPGFTPWAKGIPP
jgi:hypothetical protein